jgi:hypothetical protein
MAEVSALIGHTGFVGGTLLRQRPFDDLFNSSNIADISGRSYDLVVCAGVPAAKWIANKDPEADRAGIARLTDALARVEAGEFILISTIDVYPDPASGAEETAPIDASSHHAYGANRYSLEQWVRGRFPHARIVRLPALFGEGLRKNALYDLLNDNGVEGINPLAQFQWYPMRRLTADLDRVRESELRLVNLFTEPLPMRLIIDAFFPGAGVGPDREPAPRYDLRTCHAQLFGGTNGYMTDALTILGEMALYIAAERQQPGRKG